VVDVVDLMSRWSRFERAHVGLWAGNIATHVLTDSEGPRRKQAATTSLAELALLFLRLGATAFGGPAAHIAMMRDEVVSRRKWLTEEHFLDLLGATNLIPGPNSTEMAIHIGWGRRRWSGLIGRTRGESL
jgi:hypothetical protein